MMSFMAKKKSCRWRPRLSETRARAGLCSNAARFGKPRPAATLFDVARLRTDPQHTPPPLPLLRSRPGGVRGAGVVRSPKSDKFSRGPSVRAARDGTPTRVHHNPLGAVNASAHPPQVRARVLARGLDLREHLSGLRERAPRVDGHELLVGGDVRVVKLARLDATRGEDLVVREERLRFEPLR